MVFCNKCRCETDLEIDDARGISCCVQCGCVLEDIAFSADVTFQKDAAGESTVVGQFVNESGVARGIGRIHGGRVYAYQADSHERAQQRGRQDIAHLVDHLSVRPREETIEASHRLYKLALQRGFTRGRRTNQVAAACLYLICRQDGKPFLLIDFSDALQVNVFTLGAVFLQLAKLLRLEEHPVFSKPVDPSLYIHRFADRMSFPSLKEMKAVSETALRLLASMKRDWIQTGRRPSGVCGAALYIAAHLHGYPKAKRDVVSVVHIGEHTLAKRLTEFSSTDAGEMTGAEFEEHHRALMARETEALEGATPAEAREGLLAGCEHISMGEAHFQQGMCRACFVEFVKDMGGTYDGANPPAFLKNRAAETKKAAVSGLLALPAPPEGGSEDKEGEGEEEDEEAEKAAEEEEEEEEAAGGKGKKRGRRGGKKKEAPAPAPTPKGKKCGRSKKAAAAEPEEPAEEEEGGEEGGAAKAARLTAAMVEAAEKEVEGFDAAIAEAEAADAQRSAKRRRTMSTAAAVAAANAAAVRQAAQVAGAGDEDAEAAAGAALEPPSAADGKPSNGGGGGGGERVGSAAAAQLQIQLAAAAAEQQQQEDEVFGGAPRPGAAPEGGAAEGGAAAAAEAPAEDDGALSEIEDEDIAMYLADEAEVAVKEEIWNLLNQDWVEKQAAKRAAMEAAERAQTEQRAAMEAAAAAGIQYKRGRGRPLGSKTKPKPDANLPPAESAQEAAMRMLDNKKLSSKINYSVLAELFDDEPGPSGAGRGGEAAAAEEEEAGPAAEAPAAAALEAEDEGPSGASPRPGGIIKKRAGAASPKAKTASRFAGLRPGGGGAAAARPVLGGLGGGLSGGALGAGLGRLGGLNEGLAPVLGLGAPLGGHPVPPPKKASAFKVRFKPGTKPS